LEKLKFFQKKSKNSKEDSNNKDSHLYIQASSPNIKEILKLKKNFPNLSSKKIKDIYKTINDSEKIKPRINMTTKNPSRRQIIISMGSANISKFMSISGKHITNINRALKNIKSEILADFVHTDYRGLIITTNKVASQSDLNTIKKYIKNVDTIKLVDIMVSYLPQSKLYLKIIGIPYIIKDTNVPIDSSIIETIIKSIHIFNNIYLASKLCIIKASPKSDIIVIWENIWNTQSSLKAKYLGNRYFNVGNYITTV